MHRYIWPIMFVWCYYAYWYPCYYAYWYLDKGVHQGPVLGPLSFNICINDMFYSIENCSLYNYADDNSISNSAPTVEELLSNLNQDCWISALRWYQLNGMEANRNKLQFLISSPTKIENIELKMDENSTITSEPFVKALDIYIDNRLTVADHIRSSCAKAAKQLNALSRISKFFDLKCKKMISKKFHFKQLYTLP